MKEKRYFRTQQNGMTLIELTVVFLILVAMAGLALPYARGTTDMAMCQATDASLYAIKQAIMGGGSHSGYYMDTLGKLPQDLNGLAENSPDPEYGLYYLFSPQNLQKSRTHQNFNVNTGVGWRAPYLTTGFGLNTDELNHLDTSFGTVFDSTDAGTPAYVHFDIKLHDGNDADTVKTDTEAATVPHALDAWGRPIILQIPYDTATGKYNREYARLVSAGPTLSSAIIDTKIQYDSGVNPLPDAADRKNDRVLYLKMPDPLPGGNKPCNE